MSDSLVRIGPVHFQSLERELQPVAQYLTGHVLNAGCGSRDISFLNAARVTRYDLQSDDPDVILGPLEATPFDNAAFDSVLCNAVLEHVADPKRCLRELARVVKPGGHVVVAIPFLQPFHPCPDDYTRYTKDGLASLGREAGLEVVEILPVHSIAQTLGWIAWAYAQEKQGFLRRAVVFVLVYIATRLFNRTDTALVANANTFQAVFRRPLRSRAMPFDDSWRSKAIPAGSAAVPTMLLPDELRLLNFLADDYYSGAGAIIDAGSFLGGSTLALAEGLRRNLRRRGRAEEKIIRSYDRFRVEDWTVGTFFPQTTAVGESFRDQFDRNIAHYADLIEVHEGDVRSLSWCGRPIEILFIDIAKHWTTCDWITWQFFPSLIPGRSIVVQQDYLYHHWVAWLHVTMEYYADYFEYVCDTGMNSVAFLHTRRIPPHVLREKTVESLSTEEKTDLMDRAAARFGGRQRELMQLAKEHFLEMLRT